MPVGCGWVGAAGLEAPAGGMRWGRRLAPPARLALLCGLLAAAAGAGRRALSQLSDDVPFRVNWPGTEFSLVSAGGWERVAFNLARCSVANS